MRRISIMTVGFVLIMVGVQLNVVESYRLTPRFSNFVSEHGGPVYLAEPNLSPESYTQSIQQASYYGNREAQVNLLPNQLSATKVINPPRWLCWPVLFLGGVLTLQGFIRND